MNKSFWLFRIILLTACLSGIGDLYGQFQSMESLSIEQCLDLANEKEQLGELRDATSFLNSAAEKAWERNKDYINAIEYYTQSIKLNEKIPNLNGIAGINTNLGLIYFDLGEFEKSYDYLQKAYLYRKEHKEYFAVINGLINISTTLNKMERYNESIEALEEALSVASNINNLEQMRSCFAMLSEVYTKAGNNDKAGEYLSKYVSIQQSIVSEQEKRHKTELSEATYKAQLADAERELAEARRRYADYELAELGRELIGLDSANRKLLESKTRAELIIENYRDKEKIKELETKEIEAKLEKEQMKARNLRIGLFGTFIIVVVIGIFLWQKRIDNKKLTRQNVLINKQNADLEAAFSEIREKNHDLITANDNLAKAQKELEDYQEKLEDSVAARTSQLMKLLDQAQESDKLKTAFFNNMSHEIRTPLNSILGFAQMFDKPNMTSEKRTLMTFMIKYNSTQLTQMFEDVVSLSEIDSGVIQLMPRECKINDMLNEVITEISETARIAGKDKVEIILDNHIPEDIDHFVIDGKKVYRILKHLIDNALKNTDVGYIIMGSEVSEMDKSINFWVEDTGAGIDKEDFDYVFKRFWKKGESSTQKHRGLGIGLSLCKEFINLMNGKIGLNSEYGRGSTFSFSVYY